MPKNHNTFTDSIKHIFVHDFPPIKMLANSLIQGLALVRAIDGS